MTDAQLYARGIGTLLACWAENARGAAGARLLHLAGVAVAVFPAEPERTFFNNAVVARGLDRAARDVAIEAMEAAYASARITDFAVWVHELDAAMCDDLVRRGYSVNEMTRAMGMALDDLAVARPTIPLAAPDWSEYLRILDVPGLLADAAPTAYHVLIATLDDERVATAMAYDAAGDCGIFNVSTLDHARRQGLGTALTALQLHDARVRGCRSATLQSTAMAEHLYASLGFRDLGRLLEFVR
jgi:GNAT superfamily N-acetyltransferase